MDTLSLSESISNASNCDLIFELIINDFVEIFFKTLAFGPYEQLVFFPLRKNIKNINPIEKPPK